VNVVESVRFSEIVSTSRRNRGNSKYFVSRELETIFSGVFPDISDFITKRNQARRVDGIIAHLSRECGGNVRDRHVVDITSGSFEKQTYGANPHSGAYNNSRIWAAQNAADLENTSVFGSAFRQEGEGIQFTRNNWLCYDFKERRIVPTHYTIRTYDCGPGDSHLRSWVVETSTDGENWREVAREKNNDQLNGHMFVGTFALAGAGECRFIRLVQIGRNYQGNDTLYISAWEIFGMLVE
jgi:hypothetical protein